MVQLLISITLIMIVHFPGYQSLLSEHNYKQTDIGREEKKVLTDKYAMIIVEYIGYGGWTDEDS